jgi:hypothetical protein
VLTKVEQINDNLFVKTCKKLKMNPTKKCMYQLSEDEVIRNENEVKKAEQGQYQRYPSESSQQVSTDQGEKEKKSIIELKHFIGSASSTE